jgi:hypothetical protein
VLAPESFVKVDDDLECRKGRERKAHGGADWPCDHHLNVLTVVNVELSGLGIHTIDSSQGEEVLFHELEHAGAPVHVVRADAGEAASLGSLHGALHTETEVVAVLLVHAHHGLPVGNESELGVLSWEWPARLGLPYPDSGNDPVHMGPPDSCVVPSNLRRGDLVNWRPVEHFNVAGVGTRAALQRIHMLIKPDAGLPSEDLKEPLGRLLLRERKALISRRVVDEEHVPVERTSEAQRSVGSEPRRVTEAALRAEGPRILGESADEQLEVQVDYVLLLHLGVNLVVSGWLGFHEWLLAVSEFLKIQL